MSVVFEVWCQDNDVHLKRNTEMSGVIIIMHIFKLKIDPDYFIFLLLRVALQNMSWLLALPTIYIYNT